jgi:hypothetical protein
MATSVQTREGGLTPAFGSYPLETLAPAGYSSPYFTWRQGDRDDGRQCPRRNLRCKMYLVDDAMEQTADPAMIAGECLNVGDGGLYGTVPVGYGVAMGQRYTFRLLVDERGPEPGAVQMVAQRGMVVRTELLIGRDGHGDRLGIGVKLTGHRSGVIPMPMWV